MIGLPRLSRESLSHSLRAGSAGDRCTRAREAACGSDHQEFQIHSPPPRAPQALRCVRSVGQAWAPLEFPSWSPARNGSSNASLKL